MLTWVLERQGATLLVAIATLALTSCSTSSIPKGFFPVQDTGVIQGISEAPQTISFAAMAERQQALATGDAAGPGRRRACRRSSASTARNATLNSGRMLINLKPRASATPSATEVIRRLQRRLAAVEGIALYMQPVQDLTIEDRVSRTQYQFTLEYADADELRRLGAAARRPACGDCRELARRRERPAGRGPAGVRRNRPRHREPARHHAGR